MKKIYYSFACGMLAFTGFSQRSADLELIINSPADNTVIATMDPFSVMYTVKNNGTADITTSDSLRIFLEINDVPIEIQPGGYIALSPTAIANGSQTAFTRMFAFDNSYEGEIVNICLRLEVVNNASPITDPALGNNQTCVSLTVDSQTASLAETDKKLEIWPNPCTDVIRFSPEIKAESATVRDLAGKSFGVSISNDNALQLADLAPGIYILQLETEEGTVTKQFMKQ